MTDYPTKEFGRRRPPPTAPPEPVKRSHHVALLLMGTIAIGGGAYALMPSETCRASQPGMATDPAQADCSKRQTSSSGGHGSWGGGSSSRTSLFGGDDPSGENAGSSSAEAGRVSRGGFGSFARAFAMHFSGGG